MLSSFTGVLLWVAWVVVIVVITMVFMVLYILLMHALSRVIDAVDLWLSTWF